MDDDSRKHPDTAKPRILGVGSSPRKGGNSDVLLRHILKGAKENSATVESVQLRDYLFQACNGCERCRKEGVCVDIQDGMQLLYPKVIGSNGLILISPAHNYNVTAWMKAFIDRLYCFYVFDDERPRKWYSTLEGQNRKAVIAVVCEQTNPDDMGFTLPAMRRPLEALGYEVVGELPVYGIFDRGHVAKHPEVLSNAEHLGQILVQSITGG